MNEWNEWVPRSAYQNYVSVLLDDESDSEESVQQTITASLADKGEWVSRFLTAQQHNLGHLVPLKVKSEKRESNHQTKFFTEEWK